MRKFFDPLNQTRKSLSAEDSYLEQPGQLLDKALAKQIAVREAELDSLAAPSNKKNIFVIVRCWTPDPEATCTKKTPASHFPDPDKVPEDFSISLNYFLESTQDLEAPPLPPRHTVLLNNSPLAHPTAPEVPWTPPRHSPYKRHSTLGSLKSYHTLEPAVLDLSTQSQHI